MEAGVNPFLERYAKLGERVPASITLKPTLRVNTLRISEEKIIARLTKLGVKLSKILWLKHGYTVEQSKFSLGASVEALLGYFYLQEAAAQVPVEVLDPKPGETVLDCCASPGGKTTQLAQQMKNTGVIVSLEKKSHRLLSLRNNIERCGVSNAVVYHMDAVKAAQLGMKFDKILLDAPCSGNYAGDSGWFAKRNIDDIKKSAQFQRNLLQVVTSLLKPDGVLVYSTCTLEPEENELNMQWAIDQLGIKLEPIPFPIGDPGLTDVFGKQLDKSVAHCKRFWPHKTNTEGFFIAKMRRK
jgi:NOL1/NOP2/sun family putative RNA methylase